MTARRPRGSASARQMIREHAERTHSSSAHRLAHAVAMRRALPVLATIAILCAATPAWAAPGAGSAAGPGGSGKSSKRVCADLHAGDIRCYALVETDVTGAAVAFAVPVGYGPDNLRAAYPVVADFTTAGSGRTIAIVDAQDNPNAEADLAVYRSQFGLTPCTTANGCFTKVNQNGQAAAPAPDVGWGEEIALDLDMASAMCPACKILLVEATSASLANLDVAENYAAAHAFVVSNSFGAAEFSQETSAVNDGAFHHPGVPITVSSGDSGFGAQFPAASPYVTAVGGTTLNASIAPRGWTETAWSGAGSGCSAFEPKPTRQHDTGCGAHRTIADVSAVADPATGVAVYDTFGTTGWLKFGGTSAAAPIVAAAFALIGATTPDYFYANSGALFDVVSGSNGACAGSYLCTALPGYDGPTGLGTLGSLLPAPQPPPTALTGPPSAITPTGATITGTVNPAGQPTSYHFEYGTTTAYGTSTPLIDAGAGAVDVPVAATIAGLTAARTYHYRLVAANAAGTTLGADASFTTPAAPPAATTRAASGVKATSARLNGTVNPNGRATTYRFDYGLTSSYGSSSASASAGSGTAAVNVGALQVSALARSTTYHFRIVATSSAGTTTGADLTFRTTA